MYCLSKSKTKIRLKIKKSVAMIYFTKKNFDSGKAAWGSVSLSINFTSDRRKSFSPYVVVDRPKLSKVFTLVNDL